MNCVEWVLIFKKPSDVIWCCQTWSALVHIMACCLVSAQSFPEAMLTCCQVDPWQSSKCIWKCPVPDYYIISLLTSITIFVSSLNTRYMIHLWDMHHEGVWEHRASLVYYTDFLFEMATLTIEFVHHLHMLVRNRHSLSDYLLACFCKCVW